MRLQAGLWVLAVSSLSTTAMAQASGHATGLVVPADREYGVPYFAYPVDTDFADLPETYDLREQGVVTPVKNQGSCGSCWAFAGTAVMETAQAIAGRGSMDLAEQELISCDSSQYGCGGGWQPFDYMIRNGQSGEESFPYQARDTSCRQRSPVAHAQSWGNVGQSGRRASVNEVRKALVDHGALWVTVAAGSTGWGNPGAIKRNCYSAQIDHAVTLVGYEPDGQGGYNFIVKNSWGEDWNGDGFVKMHLGCDNLGETTSFVVPADDMCAPPAFGLGKTAVATDAGVQLAAHLESDASFTWLRDGKEVASGLTLPAGVAKDGDYVVRARTSCGVWEQKVKVAVAR